MQTEILLPRRVRVPRGAYGWVDLKVVTGGWLEPLGPDAALTYLFLCAVGNSRGLSFWSRGRMALTLGLSKDAIDRSFEKLLRADLIACRERLVQVLSLPERQPEPERAEAEPTAELLVPEDEIRQHEAAALARLQALRTTGAPPEAVVRALAQSMARESRRRPVALPPAPGGEGRG